MALPNPGFEPETPRWRPGAGAPSWEVPSRIYAFLGHKQPFFAQDSPKTWAKRPNEGNWCLHHTCGLTSPCQSALYCPSTPRYVRETAQKGAKKPQICAMCTNTPKPSTGRILGYVAQNLIPRAPSPPATPHFLWFPSLRIAQRATQTPVPVVTWLSQRASQPAHGGGQRWVHQCPRGEKNNFFQSCSQTTWDAQTSVFRPF